MPKLAVPDFESDVLWEIAIAVARRGKAIHNRGTLVLSQAIRLRGRCFQSDRTASVGFSVLTLDAASVWSGPNGTTRLDWMTIGMTKAHSILCRVPST